jgi:hypothetical protein
MIKVNATNAVLIVKKICVFEIFFTEKSFTINPTPNTNPILIEFNSRNSIMIRKRGTKEIKITICLRKHLVWIKPIARYTDNSISIRIGISRRD